MDVNVQDELKRLRLELSLMKHTFILNNKVESGDGWTKLPDGTMIQWGYDAVDSAGAAVDGLVSIHLHKPFISMSYTVQLTNGVQSSSGKHTAAYEWVKTSSTNLLFVVRGITIGATLGYTAPTYKVSWMAIGRWKH